MGGKRFATQPHPRKTFGGLTLNVSALNADWSLVAAPPIKLAPEKIVSLDNPFSLDIKGLKPRLKHIYVSSSFVPLIPT